MKEANIGKEILLACSRAGARVFLNPRGQGWVGNLVSILDGTAILKGARKVTFGVGPDGSADAIGWRSVTITSDMVGRKIAVFVSLEFKTPTGPTRDNQIAWRDAVLDAGGRAGIVRSPEEALKVLEGIN